MATAASAKHHWSQSSSTATVLPVTLVVMLLLQQSTVRLATAADCSGRQQRQLLSEAVPGQAFHNWRDALIKTKYSTSSSSSSKLGSSKLGSSNSSTEQQGQQSRWTIIVGLRDRIAKLAGPAKVNTTHPSAARRLAEAFARKQPAARRTAAEAAHQTTSAASAAFAAASSLGSQAILAVNKRHDDSSDHSATGGASTSSGADSAPLATGQPAAESEGPLEYDITAEELELTLMSFVRRDPEKRHLLTVNNKQHVMIGFDIPDALQMAAQPSQRHQLLYLLDLARQLSYNTVRIWAFSDGAAGVDSAVDGAWQLDRSARERVQADDQLEEAVLQPAPGVLDTTVMSGVDWLIAEAGVRGLRVILVLTNGGSTAGGGMQQYTHWVDPALTVVDFYGNDTVKSVFLDYISGLLSHESSVSGLPLREDPVIAGWQLAHNPQHPGQPASEHVLAWVRQMGIFMKEHAPHQLFLTGLEGYFGPHSPHLLQHNPHAQVFDSASVTPHSYTATCSGVDFWYHHQLEEVDMATAAVYPDAWMACSRSCKLSWTREWIRGHLRDAVRLQKPLLLAGVGVLRSHSWRHEFLQLLQSELERAVAAGHPLAGIILPPLLHPGQPDVSGYGMYGNSTGAHRQRPPLADVTLRAVSDVMWHRFMHHSEYLSCLLSEEQARDMPSQ